MEEYLEATSLDVFKQLAAWTQTTPSYGQSTGRRPMEPGGRSVCEKKLQTFTSAEHLQRLRREPLLLTTANATNVLKQTKYYFLCAHLSLLPCYRLAASPESTKSAEFRSDLTAVQRLVTNEFVLAIKTAMPDFTVRQYVELLQAYLYRPQSLNSAQQATLSRIFMTFDKLPVVTAVFEMPLDNQQLLMQNTFRTDSIVTAIQSYTILPPTVQSSSSSKSFISTTPTVAGADGRSAVEPKKQPLQVRLLQRTGIPVIFMSERFDLAYVFGVPVKQVWYPTIDDTTTMYPNVRAVLFNLLRLSGGTALVVFSATNTPPSKPNSSSAMGDSGDTNKQPSVSTICTGNRVVCAWQRIDEALMRGNPSNIRQSDIKLLLSYTESLNATNEKLRQRQTFLTNLLQLFVAPISLPRLNSSEIVIINMLATELNVPLSAFREACASGKNIKFNQQQPQLADSTTATRGGGKSNNSPTTSTNNSRATQKFDNNLNLACSYRQQPTFGPVLVCDKFSDRTLSKVLEWSLLQIRQKSTPTNTPIRLILTELDICPIQVRYILGTFKYILGYAFVETVPGREYYFVYSPQYLSPYVLKKLDIPKTVVPAGSTTLPTDGQASSSTPLKLSGAGGSSNGASLLPQQPTITYDWLDNIHINQEEWALFIKLVQRVSPYWTYEEFHMFIKENLLNQETVSLLAAFYGVNRAKFVPMLVAEQMFELHCGKNILGVSNKYRLYTRLSAKKRIELYNIMSGSSSSSGKLPSNVQRPQLKTPHKHPEGSWLVDMDRYSNLRIVQTLDLVCNAQAIWDTSQYAELQATMASVVDGKCQRIDSTPVVAKIVNDIAQIENDWQLRYKLAAQYKLSEFAIMRYWHQTLENVAKSNGGDSATATIKYGSTIAAMSLIVNYGLESSLSANIEKMANVLGILLLTSTASNDLKAIVYASLQVKPMPFFATFHIIPNTLDDFYRLNYGINRLPETIERNEKLWDNSQRPRRLELRLDRSSIPKREPLYVTSVAPLVWLDYVRKTQDAQTLALLQTMYKV